MSNGLRARVRVRWVAVVAALLAIASIITSVNAAARKPVEIQILNVSDWHGQLDPLVINNVNVGGAAALAAYFQQERAANPNTLTLTAGDGVGATPPVSSFFEDIPAIQAMRLMGFQADTLGNHNFDAGLARLQGQIDLAGSTTEAGKPFVYLSANLKNVKDNLTNVKKMKIFDVGGVKVAVIGITNPEAPGLVFPGNFGTIEITDPVVAANEARAEARKQGAQVVIALIHAGITGTVNGAGVGPVVDFANGVTGFDLILGDHTDFQYQATINGALVTENKSKGATYSRVNLSVDTVKGVTSKSVTFKVPTAGSVTPDPTIASLIQSYKTQLQPVLGTVIGSSTRAIPRSDACNQSAGRTCESLVGNVATDAFRNGYEVDFAITNSGGLRAALTCPVAGGGDGFCPAATQPPYLITRGQVLTVLPFGNFVVTVEMSGAELKAMLENGVSRMPQVDGRFPQVSGLCFTYDISVAAGNRVTGAVRQAEDGTCTSTTVDLSAGTSYSVAMNDFMGNGGDGYPNFGPRVKSNGELMETVVSNYITGKGSISPTIQGRIACEKIVNPASPNSCPIIITTQ
jgi:2',3'-cyclic-nucleotide 2'-phosphodiesterase (5'-nucleotidase family)